MNQDNMPGSGVDRRGFLKLSVWGGAALAVGAGPSTLLTSCSSDPGPASGYKHLRDKDVTLLRPLMAPLLGGGLEALQAMVISTGLPFTAVVLTMCWAIFRGLQAEAR